MIHKMSRPFILLFLLMLQFLIVQSNAQTTTNIPLHEDRDLITKAYEKIDIFTLPAFEMKAIVKTGQKDKDNPEGSYVLLWNGPRQWKEELTFPGFDEIRIANEKGVIHLPNKEPAPLLLSHIHSVLHLDAMPSLGLNSSLFQANCPQSTDGKDKAAQLCSDQLPPDPLTGKKTIPVGSKLFPEFFYALVPDSSREGKMGVVVAITELKTMEQFPSSAFLFPAGTTPKLGCFNPKQPKLVKGVQVPLTETTPTIINVNALIATDGKLKKLKVISRNVSSMTYVAVLSTLQQWRYVPAQCNGSPVETDTVITFTETPEVTQ